MARFFCDHCGEEVRRDSSQCPRCGRYFAFVRCPQCSFSGEEKRFAKGCPSCGYCTPEQKKVSPGSSWTAAGKLPLWVYIVAALGLAAMALVFYITVR
ncbi:MAG: hypothetical protein FWG27_07715 [Treponema sp.]|nr:hypothetical protein [Treponema sp.]